MLPNSITNKLPGVAQTEKCGTFGCGWYSLGQVPSVGSDVTVTGHGVLSDENPIPQPQQTKTGPVVAVTPISLRYSVDVMVRRNFTCSIVLLFCCSLHPCESRLRLLDLFFTCQHTNLMSLTKSHCDLLLIHRVETLEHPSWITKLARPLESTQVAYVTSQL